MKTTQQENTFKLDENLLVTLNYTTIEQAKVEKFPIYMEYNIENEQGFLELSVDQAKWLAKKLNKLVNKLEK